MGRLYIYMYIYTKKILYVKGIELGLGGCAYLFNYYLRPLNYLTHHFNCRDFNLYGPFFAQLTHLYAFPRLSLHYVR
jgi:hypothetical protein